MAQLGARLDGIEEVEGSNPFGSTIPIRMRHFVQYHKPELMGPYERSRQFWIVTNKPARLALGDRVWLVTGEGKRRSYFLCATFVVGKLEELKSGKFKYKASGLVGKSFKRQRIDSLPWFPQLQRLAGNFRFGVQRIRRRIVIRGLERFLP